ncbi:low specificity L-threonine aldolase [Gordonia sp. SID5947]|uniref:threonine aldolase family protein n=1 Tax=Gordonia sp. SID5947 TaxID=2690315 RepID=UPI00136E3670|nr:low specificity L-threonine aldolase [Gordonia sp. SID5947]MYR06007.1 low specificity L-threonine aldolase [Gordonia sp. SID5947]
MPESDATLIGHPVDRMFASDNGVGASAEIVEAVARAAAGGHLAYGQDVFTAEARRKVAEVFEHAATVHCVSTGSAANGLALATLLDPWGSVLCHRGSHVFYDECGAPEFFTAGGKLIPLDGPDGKIDPDELSRAVRAGAGSIHSAQPQVVSITQATESGSLHGLDEIRALTTIAHDAGLRVHMDGARFANALVALDVSPAEMSWRAGVDMLSFGVTKNGGLTTDAVVCFDPAFETELGYRVKRAGQLTSKMRFQSAQLDAYLTDDLWLRNARHANAMAEHLVAGLRATPDVHVRGNGGANIVFCHLPDAVADALVRDGFVFHHGHPEPGVARLVTSHATTRDAVDALLAAINQALDAA